MLSNAECVEQHLDSARGRTISIAVAARTGPRCSKEVKSRKITSEGVLRSLLLLTSSSSSAGAAMVSYNLVNLIRRVCLKRKSDAGIVDDGERSRMSCPSLL